MPNARIAVVMDRKGQVTTCDEYAAGGEFESAIGQAESWHTEHFGTEVIGRFWAVISLPDMKDAEYPELVAEVIE